MNENPSEPGGGAQAPEPPLTLTDGDGIGWPATDAEQLAPEFAPDPEAMQDDDLQPDPEHEIPPESIPLPLDEPSTGPIPVTATATQPEVGESTLTAIERLGDRLDRKIGDLQVLMEREVRAEATRERIVDRLHTELQEYKQDLMLKVQRPIFVDLIQLHDDIGKMIEARPDEEAGPASPRHDSLASIRTAIEDILYRQGVEPFTCDGDGFDARRQRAVTTVVTEEAALNRTIAARLRPGFQAGEKVLRPEIVSVHTLKRP